MPRVKKTPCEPRWTKDGLQWLVGNKMYPNWRRVPNKDRIDPPPAALVDILLQTPAPLPVSRPAPLDPVLWDRLYPYQREAVSDIVHRKKGRVLLADDMGLGKTLQTIAVILSYPQAMPVLIVAPTSLRSNWAAELRKWAPDRHVTLLDKGENEPGPDINVMSYGMLNSTKMVPKLKRVRWRFLVLDESHRVKNRTAKRTKAVTALSRRIPHIVLLSGTPLNRPVELYSQLKIVNSKLYPRFWQQFGKASQHLFGARYCKPTKEFIPGGFTWSFKGAERIEELYAVLRHTVMIRRTKEILNLPDLTREITILGELPPRLLKAKLARFDRLRSPEEGKKLQADAEFMELVRSTMRRKVAMVQKWCKDILHVLMNNDPMLQVLIFSRHHEMTDGLREVFPDAVWIDGRVPKTKRGSLVEAFQRGERRVALLGLQAASEGLNMTQATLVLHTELDFVPNTHLQAEARAHRNGQKRKVLSRYLLLRNSTDDVLWSMISSKVNVASRTIDNCQRVLGKHPRDDEEEDEKVEDQLDFI